MRLGGPLFEKCESPEAWASAVRRAGYRASYCPIGTEADDSTIAAYREIAERNDIVIAEVGAWSSPLSRDESKASAAMEKCKASLALADKLGAKCCVNIVGSRGKKCSGPDREDLTEETFEMVVASVREIIETAREVTGHPIPSVIAPPRPGDPPVLVAATDKAAGVLSWRPQIPHPRDIIESAWQWHRRYPQGYSS